jgi:hypothetical protein
VRRRAAAAVGGRRALELLGETPDGDEVVGAGDDRHLHRRLAGAQQRAAVADQPPGADGDPHDERERRHRRDDPDGPRAEPQPRLRLREPGVEHVAQAGGHDAARRGAHDDEEPAEPGARRPVGAERRCRDADDTEDEEDRLAGVGRS